MSRLRLDPFALVSGSSSRSAGATGCLVSGFAKVGFVVVLNFVVGRCRWYPASSRSAGRVRLVSGELEEWPPRLGSRLRLDHFALVSGSSSQLSSGLHHDQN